MQRQRSATTSLMPVGVTESDKTIPKRAGTAQKSKY